MRPISTIDAFVTVAAALALALWFAPGALSSQSAQGAVKITSEPSGARVWVDDMPRGTTPALLELAAGRRALRIEHPRFVPVVRTIQVTTNRLHTHHLVLEADARTATAETRSKPRKAPPPAPAARIRNLDSPNEDPTPGTVAIATTPPGLTVFMNEELILQPTPVFFEIRPGIYELRIEDQGETVFRRTIFVRPGALNDLELTIRKTRRIDYSDPWK